MEWISFRTLKSISSLSLLIGEQDCTSTETHSTLHPFKLNRSFSHIPNHPKSIRVSLCINILITNSIPSNLFLGIRMEKMLLDMRKETLIIEERVVITVISIRGLGILNLTQMGTHTIISKDQSETSNRKNHSMLQNSNLTTIALKELWPLKRPQTSHLAHKKDQKESSYLLKNNFKVGQVKFSS